MTDVMSNDNTRLYGGGYERYRTLKIASDLEAALKHEEEKTSSPFRSLGRNTGLPVPPRGTRRDGSISFQSTFSVSDKLPKPILPTLVTSTPPAKQVQARRSGGNPYINKAPGSSHTRAVRRSMSTSTTTESDSTSNFVGSVDDGASNRISISSKSYPSSSIEGHDEYYYVRPSSRQSFLDFSPVSPSAPQVPPKPSPPPSSASASSSHREASIELPAPVQSAVTAPRAQMSVGASLTTNKLHKDERAELVWRSRKLAQVFGKPPSAFDLQQQEQHARNLPTTPDGPLHPFASVSPPARRHSIPLVQSRSSFLDTDASDSEPSTPNTPAQRRRQAGRNGKSSSHLESFIFLSDEEDIPRVTSKNNPVRQSFDSGATSELSMEAVLEEERRRMRDKIAKLHRYLGSRVPTSLILGVDEAKIEPCLPPPSPCQPMSADQDSPERPVWLRRRRSSSEAAAPFWSDDVDRSREHLDDREKARNVRRAQKMEKLFGVAPPQNLYHTRQSPSISISGYHTSTGNLPGGAAPRKLSPRRQKLKRPSTSDSTQGLLSDRDHRPSISGSPYEGRHDIYYHYQHSLTQLNDIMDRADTESLLQLDEYLHSDQTPSSPPLQEFTRSDRRLSSASSTKSDRRHSLPASISAISTISEEPSSDEMAEFQSRRRKVAKLTRFFGEDYIILLTKVLGSIEKSVEEESLRGTLDPDQVKELQQKLRTLRTKRV